MPVEGSRGTDKQSLFAGLNHMAHATHTLDDYMGQCRISLRGRHRSPTKRTVAMNRGGIKEAETAIQ